MFGEMHLAEASHVGDSRAAWQQAADETFQDQLAGNTLTELEDIAAHLDRIAHPERFQGVREEIDRRLEQLEQAPPIEDGVTRPGVLWRRVWASLLDLFVMLLILGAGYAVVTAVAGILGSFGEQEAAAGPMGPRGRAGSSFVAFMSGLASGDGEAWANTAQWRRFGTGAGLFLGLRALFLLPLWVRSGRSPGMRELGLQVRAADGSGITWGRGLFRFVAQYVLFVLTLGISALWSLWDSGRRTLHDRLTGTQVVRLQQAWEKPQEARLLE